MSEESSSDKKSSTQRAMEKFLNKELKKIMPKQPEDNMSRKTSNMKPEKVTERNCLNWMRAQGWLVEIYESKATYDPRTQCYRQQSMRAGTCDCQGTMPDGISVAVEFKALGRLSTFTQDRNQRQIDFIKNKITSNAFACVVDSVGLLEEIYINWKQRRDMSLESARKYLELMLPKKNKKENDIDPMTW